MATELVVPWFQASRARLRALDWVYVKLAALDIKPIITSYSGPEWIKARAIMPAVRGLVADIIVLHDADCWTDGLIEAIQAVQDGAAWAIPHWEVYRLSQTGTEALLRGEDWTEQDLERSKYVGMPGGGIIVTTHDTLLDIPLDPRFVGWGHEDESHAMALWCLLGPPWRGREPLVHLWHEPQWRVSRRQGSDANWRLRNRYANARHDVDRMGKIVSEARHDLGLDIPLEQT